MYKAEQQRLAHSKPGIKVSHYDPPASGSHPHGPSKGLTPGGHCGQLGPGFESLEETAGGARGRPSVEGRGQDLSLAVGWVLPVTQRRGPSEAKRAAVYEGTPDPHRGAQRRCGQRPAHGVVTTMRWGSSVPWTCPTVTSTADSAGPPGAEAREPAQRAAPKAGMRSHRTRAERCPPDSKQQDKTRRATREKHAPEKGTEAFPEHTERLPFSLCVCARARAHTRIVHVCGKLSHKALLYLDKVASRWKD